MLLDTCSLLWLAAEQESLSRTAVRLIKQNAGRLYISSISAFEIGIKAARNRLKLPLSPLQWYHEALEHHGIVEIEMSGKIALLATELPFIHNDPVDRIIIATAILEELDLLSPDALIEAYPQVMTRW